MKLFIILLLILVVILFIVKKVRQIKTNMEMEEIERAGRRAYWREVASQKKGPIKVRMLNREGDLEEDEWHTYIAGVQHHVNEHDGGGFSGIVANDPDNKHDPDAMAIYKGSRIIGYIPAKELHDYRNWCDGKPVPCVGFIFVEDGQVRGRVKMLLPCNRDFLAQGFKHYIEWIVRNYGSEYAPRGIQFEAEEVNEADADHIEVEVKA